MLAPTCAGLQTPATCASTTCLRPPDYLPLLTPEHPPAYLPVRPAPLLPPEQKTGKELENFAMDRAMSMTVFHIAQFVDGLSVANYRWVCAGRGTAQCMLLIMRPSPGSRYPACLLACASTARTMPWLPLPYRWSPPPRPPPPKNYKPEP